MDVAVQGSFFVPVVVGCRRNKKHSRTPGTFARCHSFWISLPLSLSLDFGCSGPSNNVVAELLGHLIVAIVSGFHSSCRGP